MVITAHHDIDAPSPAQRQYSGLALHQRLRLPHGTASFFAVIHGEVVSTVRWSRTLSPRYHMNDRDIRSMGLPGCLGRSCERNQGRCRDCWLCTFWNLTVFTGAGPGLPRVAADHFTVDGPQGRLHGRPETRTLCRGSASGVDIAARMQRQTDHDGSAGASLLRAPASGR